MYKVERILCPTDFSEGSLQALSAATDIAAKLGAELSIVHVVPIMSTLPTDPNFVFEVHQRQDSLFGEMEKRLYEVARESKDKGILGRVFVGHGDAAAEIVRVAKERSVDLIVVSSHGRTGLGRILFGSTAEAIVRHAPCPVLVVKPAKEEEL